MVAVDYQLPLRALSHLAYTWLLLLNFIGYAKTIVCVIKVVVQYAAERIHAEHTDPCRSSIYVRPLLWLELITNLTTYWYNCVCDTMHLSSFQLW